jgi:hypothetical protein
MSEVLQDIQQNALKVPLHFLSLHIDIFYAVARRLELLALVKSLPFATSGSALKPIELNIHE